MASVKISELNELLVLTGSDYVAIVDSSSLTTFRTPVSSIGTWMSEFGSASHALWADNAISASYALTASYANSSSNAVSSSYAVTASYYDFGFDPNVAISSSYARTASVLQGFGTSWEENLQISNSLRLQPDSEFIIPRKTNLDWDNRTNCIWFNEVPFVPAPGVSNDYSRISFIEESLDIGHLRFDHGDNMDTLYPAGPNIDLKYVEKPGFGWFSMEFSGLQPTGSLMFLSTAGELFVRKVEARDFTSSIDPGVGFYGTASYALKALTASYASNAPLPSDTKMPPSAQGLKVYPHDLDADAPAYYNIDIKARSIVVVSTTGETVQLSSVNESNLRTISGAGGLTGTYASDQWFDVYIIYRSDTEAVSSVIIPTGATRDSSTFSDVVASLGGPWDYGVKVASVWDDTGEWTRWFEYGLKTVSVYRAWPPEPKYRGIIPHLLDEVPSRFDIYFQVVKIGSWETDNGLEIKDTFWAVGIGGFDNGGTSDSYMGTGKINWKYRLASWACGYNGKTAASNVYNNCKIVCRAEE